MCEQISPAFCYQVGNRQAVAPMFRALLIYLFFFVTSRFVSPDDAANLHNGAAWECEPMIGMNTVSVIKLLDCYNDADFRRFFKAAGLWQSGRRYDGWGILCRTRGLVASQRKRLLWLR